jgi:hypothetical protein
MSIGIVGEHIYTLIYTFNKGYELISINIYLEMVKTHICISVANSVIFQSYSNKDN